MKKTFFLILLPAAMFLFSFKTPKPTRVVFFGDSITEAAVNPGGYISKMKEMLAEKGLGENFELLGAGISGNKIYDLYLRAEKDVLAKKPDVVVIWVGVNDVWHKKTHGTGTDAPKFVQFYEALVQKFQSAGIRVVLCTPACIGEKTDCTNELDGDLNLYSQMIRDLAVRLNCKLADLREAFLNFNLEKNAKNEAKGVLTTDGVHLNATGNELVAQILLNSITQ